MGQTASTEERDIVSGPIVSYEPVELIQILKELGAEPLVEGKGADLFRSDKPLECLSAVALDAVGQHEAEGGVQAGCFDVQVSYTFGGKLFFVALRVREAVVPVLAGESGSRN